MSPEAPEFLIGSWWVLKRWEGPEDVASDILSWTHHVGALREDTEKREVGASWRKQLTGHALPASLLPVFL